LWQAPDLPRHNPPVVTSGLAWAAPMGEAEGAREGSRAAPRAAAIGDSLSGGLGRKGKFDPWSAASAAWSEEQTRNGASPIAVRSNEEAWTAIAMTGGSRWIGDGTPSREAPEKAKGGISSAKSIVTGHVNARPISGAKATSRSNGGTPSVNVWISVNATPNGSVASGSRPSGTAWSESGTPAGGIVIRR